jgi:hypothetical protein
MPATWKILDRGEVPEPAQYEVDFVCPYCGRAALLPVLGLPNAQVGSGIVFDPGKHAMPTTVQCRKCRRVMTTEE